MIKLLLIHVAVLTSLLMSSVGSSATEAKIVLRASAAHHGAVVYLGDVADISAATEAEVKRLVTTPLMPAPVGDSEEFLQRGEIRELLASRGIDVSQFQLSGASVVKVGAAKRLTEGGSSRILTSDERQQTKRSVIQAIEHYLSGQTDHTQWQVELTLDDKQLAALAGWGDDLRIGSGRAPWTGRQMFLVAGRTSDDWFEIRAQVGRVQNVVVATRRLEQGQLIGVGDVEIRQEFEAVPGGHFNAIDQVLGMEVMRAVTPGTILQKNLMRAPYQVQRGETVTIFARTGGISVRTFAVAKQDGALGDLVQAETLEGRERFVAKVSGRRQLEVLATGTSANDLATANQLQTQRR